METLNPSEKREEELSISPIFSALKAENKPINCPNKPTINANTPKDLIRLKHLLLISYLAILELK